MAANNGNGVGSGESAPYSKIVPPVRIVFATSSSSGPATGSNARSTPLPDVISRTFSTQPSVFVLTTNFAPALASETSLALLRVVAIGIAPTAFANWIAADPTLLAAAVIKT